MSAARLRSHAEATLPAPAIDHVSLFKEDHPRRIDRVISFFGDSDARADDPCGEALLDLLSVAQPSRR